MASNDGPKSDAATVEELPGMPPVQLPPPQQPNVESSPTASTSQPNRRPHPTEIYKLPAPVKTFPLPTFYASNPLGVVWVAYKWVSHLLFTPNEPSVIHSAIWSPGSSSVHVVDAESMRALWEQGFYGKGSLSRSEPEWTRRRLAEQGQGGGKTSAEVTEARRVARQQKKWERARLEQEAIRKQREEEARQAAVAERNMRENAKNIRDVEDEWTAPVGPLELLRMPNSNSSPDGFVSVNGHAHDGTNGKAINGHTTTPLKSGHDFQNGIVEDLSSTGSADGVSNDRGLKKQKSVRFSPTVESTTFLFHDPPSPRHAALSSPRPQTPPQVPAKTDAPADDDHFTYFNEISGETVKVAQSEHLQLTPAEAFFLVFGLGVLVVKEPQTDKMLTVDDLFDRFRRYSYFPPRIQPAAELGPDDPFLLQYAAYHHFRSLGWVPRPGVKFGVDWLLYLRGPVFDHAQFAILVLPEYDDPAWRALGRVEGTGRSWTWFFGVNRVISQVHKKLVLAYVYVPPPEKFEAAKRQGVGEALALYKVREVMVSRWSTNRNR